MPRERAYSSDIPVVTVSGAISFSGRSIVRASGLDAFEVGDVLTIAGASNGRNNRTARATTVTATQIVFDVELEFATEANANATVSRNPYINQHLWPLDNDAAFAASGLTIPTEGEAENDSAQTAIGGAAYMAELLFDSLVKGTDDDATIADATIDASVRGSLHSADLIRTDVSLDDGATWTPLTDGSRRIPGIAVGDSLVEKRLMYRTVFLGQSQLEREQPALSAIDVHVGFEDDPNGDPVAIDVSDNSGTTLSEGTFRGCHYDDESGAVVVDEQRMLDFNGAGYVKLPNLSDRLTLSTGEMRTVASNLATHENTEKTQREWSFYEPKAIDDTLDRYDQAAQRREYALERSFAIEFILTPKERAEPSEVNPEIPDIEPGPVLGWVSVPEIERSEALRDTEAVPVTGNAVDHRGIAIELFGRETNQPNGLRIVLPHFAIWQGEGKQ